MRLLRSHKVAVLAVAALIAAVPDAPSRAQVFSYSSNVREVKVGVVVPAAWKGLRTAAPSLFYLLDQRTDLKPSGWDLTNPLAPDRVDVNILQRWNQGGSAVGTGTNANPYAEGQALTKNMAAYWEVPLDTATPEQLAQFDLLYLCPPQRGLVSMNSIERDKLRKAVDSGATLWVERTNTTVNNFNLFISVGYKGGVSSTGPVRVAQPLHPTLNSVYALSQAEINSLFGAVSQAPIGNIGGIDRTAVTPVLEDQVNNIVMAAGPYGSGYVVMAGNIGAQINSSIRQGTTAVWANGNLGGYSGNDFTRVPVAALKFAYDVLSVNQESTQERRVPRRTASTPEQIGAPLTRKWTFPDGPADPSIDAGAWTSNNVKGTSAAPAVFKGVVFVPAANGHLYAFDLDPTRDLDGDGNPDDGWAGNGPQQRPFDLSNGAPYDMLWDADLSGAINTPSHLISTPVVATVDDPTRGPIDVVFVTTEDGKMYAFEAFPRSGGRLLGQAVQYWKSPATLGDAYPQTPAVPLRIPAPVFGEGRLFAAAVSGGEGVVMELNPINGAEIWRYQRSKKPITAVPPSIGIIAATPALAWVHDDPTDAEDLVLYVPSFSEPAQGQTARIFSFLLSVRGERLSDSGDHKQFRSRYWLAPTNLAWSNYAVRAANGVTGVPIAGRPGWVEMSGTIDPSIPVYADYNLDTKSDNYKPRSAFYGFPGANGQYPSFISSPVLGPDDTLYAIATDVGRRISSLYAFKDQSPIAFVKWRYSLPGTLVLGPPAYYNGAIYVTTDTGRIIGFDTNASFYVDVAGVLDEGRKFQVQLIQEDPSLPTAFQTVAFTYNQAMFDATNITDVDPVTRQPRVHMRVYIKTFSLSGSTAIDASLAVRVRYPTANQTSQAEETVNIQASTSICGNPTQLFGGLGAAQANKLFDQGLPGGVGAQIGSGPSVAGDSLYITGGDGNIWVLPADPCALTGSGRFASQVGLQPATIPSPARLMVPAGAGPIRGPVVFSNGNLIANTPGGVMAFSQPVTLVADAMRILETRNTFDVRNQTAGSEIVWSLPETTRYSSFPRPGPGVMPAITGILPEPEKRSFSHPTSVVRLSNTNFLVADTGNNRVVEVDRSGSVLWELTSFADPLNILGGAEPLTLDTPTDVQRWSIPGPNGASEVHTLVTDSGNHRILEIRDTYLPNGSGAIPDYHVLVWSSRTNLPDHYYEYRDAQRVPGGIPGLPPGDYTIATVTNWRINSVDGLLPDTPGSSLVILSGPRRDNNGRILVNPNGTLVDPGGIVVAFARDLTTRGGQTQPITNPTSFQRFFTGAGSRQWRGLLTDGNGFYELQGQLNPNTHEITLAIVGGASGRTTPQALGVVMAKRLPSGNTLVVNQALGQIFEFDKALGILPLSPATQGTNALAQPASADRSF